jgi:hypothetical protein
MDTFMDLINEWTADTKRVLIARGPLQCQVDLVWNAFLVFSLYLLRENTLIAQSDDGSKNMQVIAMEIL